MSKAKHEIGLDPVRAEKHLVVETVVTSDGITPEIDGDGRVRKQKTYLPLTARKELERQEQRKPVSMRAKITEHPGITHVEKSVDVKKKDYPVNDPKKSGTNETRIHTGAPVNTSNGDDIESPLNEDGTGLIDGGGSDGGDVQEGTKPAAAAKKTSAPKNKSGGSSKKTKS